MNKAPYAVVLVMLALFGLAGCGRKEITALDRKKAAAAASEGQFASSLRDYTRAEGLYAQATELCPDSPDYWIALGVARKRLNNSSGAKKAYNEALDAYDAAYKKDPTQPEVLLHKAYTQALLGKIDDARSTLEQAQKKHGDNRNIRMFIETKQLDKLIAAPAFKDLAI